MASIQQDVAESNISPVLFMTVDGEPMSFFLRPGSSKRKLQPLIKSGGGMLCNMQQPGAILLIDPAEIGSFAESATHWYVSTQYIHDCIEKGEQLNLEDYRLNPDMTQKVSARPRKAKEVSPGHLGGRLAYTAEDDAAILSYVSKHKTEIGGNRLWQKMEKQGVTGHPWQSMKDRYRTQQAKIKLVVGEEETTEEDVEVADTKVEGNQKTESGKPSPAEDTLSPENRSAESDQIQMDVQSITAENTQPEAVEAQTSISPEEEVQLEQTDALPVPNGSAEPDEPQKESVPEDSPPAQLESLPNTSSKKKSSPEPEQPQRRSTRRQLQLESSSPELYGKKLRSSSSPRLSSESTSAAKSALQNDPPVGQLSSAEAKGKTAVERSEQEERQQGDVAETTQAATGSNSMPQKGEKKKEKRELGILEMAIKEFEDESESDEDEASDVQNPTETVSMKPVETKPPVLPGNAAPSTPGPGLQQETRASSSRCPPPAGCPEAAATEAVSATSMPHLFIFDRESQEEESQSVLGDTAAAPVNPQPAVNKDSAFSLTQVQLEEDKKRIRELMKETKQDLVSVTKALLKTSGDFSEARALLLTPSASSGPFWQRCDDDRLLSGDPAGRQHLQEKYGEELVAKRAVFLELEA